MTLTATDKQLLETIAGLHEVPQGAVNIRRNGEAVVRRSTANIEILSKPDGTGIDVLIKPGTKNESVHIPVIVSRSGMHDVVYNTFRVGAGSDVLIVAGCGIHNEDSQKTEHDGIHEIIVEKGARLRYTERHYGQGRGSGSRVLNPRTIIRIEEGARAELELVQIKGVDNSSRQTEATVGARGTLVLNERLFTHQQQVVESQVKVVLDGDLAGGEVLSRSVARDTSRQVFKVELVGRTACTGHVSCESIIMENSEISSIPELHALSPEAQLTHEAAIGKLSGDQVLKLMTLGLDESQAIEVLISGFLR